jgi:hypothetical protein
LRLVVVVFAVGFGYPAHAQVAETVLWSFSGGGDGANPVAGLISDERGALYGTAGGGPSSSLCFFGSCGVVFKLTPPRLREANYSETVLWSFSGADGATPLAELFSPNKNMYGTTAGGASGNGTVFKLMPPAPGQTAWTLTTLWSFSGGSDGATPTTAALIADRTGALYGTTSTGGVASPACVFGTCGVVFKLTPPARGQTAWTETVLYAFSGGSDGGFPTAGLIADGKGSLYGTAILGGVNAPTCFGGCGVVFKLAPPAAGQTSWTETVLWSFLGSNGDGDLPAAGLLADENGALYGTTQFGGTLNACGGFGCGVVFQLTGTGFVPGEGQ